MTITVEQWTAYQYRHMSEKEFQLRVLAMARMRGWLSYHTHDSRRSQAGFPDLFLVKGERALALELKRESGRATSDQLEWSNALERIPGVTARVVRPSDMPWIEQQLGSPDGSEQSQ